MIIIYSCNFRFSFLLNEKIVYEKKSIIDDHHHHDDHSYYDSFLNFIKHSILGLSEKKLSKFEIENIGLNVKELSKEYQHPFIRSL
jgi:hypothetical protein